MNVYALFPLVAIIAYIPLLVTTLNSHPWQRRHTLFVLFLVPAMTWSLIDYIFRSNFFPQLGSLLFNAIIIIYAVMAVQLHCFASSFFSPGRGRWLPLAYAAVLLTIVLVVAGYAFPQLGAVANGIKQVHLEVAQHQFLVAILRQTAHRG